MRSSFVSAHPAAFPKSWDCIDRIQQNMANILMNENELWNRIFARLWVYMLIGNGSFEVTGYGALYGKIFYS